MADGLSGPLLGIHSWFPHCFDLYAHIPHTSHSTESGLGDRAMKMRNNLSKEESSEIISALTKNKESVSLLDALKLGASSFATILTQGLLKKGQGKEVYKREMDIGRNIDKWPNPPISIKGVGSVTGVWIVDDDDPDIMHIILSNVRDRSPLRATDRTEFMTASRSNIILSNDKVRSSRLRLLDYLEDLTSQEDEVTMGM